MTDSQLDYHLRYRGAARALADSTVPYEDLVSVAMEQKSSDMERFTMATREDIGREARRIRRSRGQRHNQ